MSQKGSPKQLAKFLNYVLGRRPDEFGLVADKNGFVKIKDLLKAINEEEGLKNVRRPQINEIMITLSDHGLEVADDLIRAINREHSPKLTFALDPHVVDKGIMPTAFSKVILSSNRDLAERIGRRSDHAAVLLTVQVSHSEDQGVVFLQTGESIFLADYIPAGCFSGPPLPKELPAPRKTDKSKKEPAKMPAGSFFLDLDNKGDPTTPGVRQKKRDKKHKQRRERPPWRK
jgi:putative RNA 2'-phosphotransferase